MPLRLTRLLLLAGLTMMVMVSPAHAGSSNLLAKAPAISKKWSLTGELVAPVKLRKRPEGKVVGRLGTRTAWSKHPVSLLVLEKLRVKQVLWYRVLLAERPNGANAWIPADYVRVKRNPYRIVVNRATRRAAVYKKGKKVRSFAVVVGKPSTPTPHGLAAIWESVRQADPGAFLGPYVLHMTIHSRVLKNYGGGPGRTALHGRSGASLFDPLGSARSHGCVRMNNSEISWLYHHTLPGTPVELR